MKIILEREKGDKKKEEKNSILKLLTKKKKDIYKIGIIKQ